MEQQEQNQPEQQPETVGELKNNAIPTRLGLLIVLLAATIAGTGLWWSTDSYIPPEAVDVSKIVEQIKEEAEEKKESTLVASFFEEELVWNRANNPDFEKGYEIQFPEDLELERGTIELLLNAKPYYYENIITSQNNSFELGFQPDQDLFFYPAQAKTQNYNLISKENARPKYYEEEEGDRPIHIVVTWNFETKESSFYIDGKKVESNIENIPTNWKEKPRLGKTWNIMGTSIKNLKIYSEILTESQISEHYRVGLLSAMGYEIKNGKVVLSIGANNRSSCASSDIQDADFTTLEYIGEFHTVGYLSKDKEYVYSCREKIADAKTFEILDWTESVGMSGPEYKYVKDKDYVYYLRFSSAKIVEGADPTTFRWHEDSNLLVDKKYVYRNGERIKGSDSTTLIKSDIWYFYWMDKNNIYDYRGNVISLSDPITLVELKNGCAKDKNNLYYYGDRLSWEEDVSVDAETFDCLGDYAAKDKNYIYRIAVPTYELSIVESVDPEYCEEEDEQCLKLLALAKREDIQKIIPEGSKIVQKVDYFDLNEDGLDDLILMVEKDVSRWFIIALQNESSEYDFLQKSKELEISLEWGVEDYTRIGDGGTISLGSSITAGAGGGRHSSSLNFSYIDNGYYLTSIFLSGWNSGSESNYSQEYDFLLGEYAEGSSLSGGNIYEESYYLLKNCPLQSITNFVYGSECERVEETDEERLRILQLESHGYHIYESKVIFDNYDNEVVVDGADTVTFEVVVSLDGHGGYAKDKNGVYYDGKKIIHADPDTFEVLYGVGEYGQWKLRAKDKNYVYENSQILEGKNPEDYQILDQGEIGPACLASGTKILMSDSSYKNIENIKVGDLVISYDIETKEYITSKVDKVIKRKDPLVIINDILHAAPDEPLYLADGSIKQAVDIKTGDYLLGEKGDAVEVIETKYDEEVVDTYDFTLENGNNFFADGYLVGTPDL